MAGSHLPYPDTVFFNGKIRTFASGAPIAQAVACSGGRIVAVGTSEEVLRLCGADTRDVNLKGRTVIPGLTDAHVHLADKGLAERELVDCRDFYGPVSTIDAVLLRLSKKAAETPTGHWVVGQGSPMQDFRMKDKRFPDRKDLDAAVPEHPVSVSFGAHVTVANSEGLGLAGINRDTPDPAGGSIERDSDTGEPTGILNERAQHIVSGVIPDFDATQRKLGIAYAVQTESRTGRHHDPRHRQGSGGSARLPGAQGRGRPAHAVESVAAYHRVRDKHRQRAGDGPAGGIRRRVAAGGRA